MDGSGGMTDWHRVQYVQSVNVTPEAIHANIRANAGRDLPTVGFNCICICASGPSLADHIEDIRARQAAGWHVAAMNGSHNFLIEKGITPDYMFMVDARPVNLPFLRLANDRTTYVIASQCQPEIFAELEARGCKTMLWQMFHDQGGFDAICETLGPGHTAISKFAGAYNVGQSCLTPIWALGYKVWHLFGYDGSMREGERHAFTQWQNADEEVHELMFRGEVYAATGTMAHHAETFHDCLRTFRGFGVHAEIIGDGLLPAMVRDRDRLLAVAAEPARPAPPPRPRARAVEKLQIVTFKWNGHVPYTAEDVNIWGRQIDRWLDMPHEFVCVTDDADGIDGAIRTVPLWREHFEHGRDWHRLKLFAEEMADIIGPRFVCTDLDTVFCGRLAPLFEHDTPFKAWADPYRAKQYCTSVFQMDAGSFPHVYDEFDAEKALALRDCGRFSGYDQAWISFVLPEQPVWTRQDGIYSFRADLLGNGPLPQSESAPYRWAPPAGARIINFHGKHNPRDGEVQEAFPWIRDFWR